MGGRTLTQGIEGTTVALLLYLGPVLGLDFMVPSVSLKVLFLPIPALHWVFIVVVKHHDQLGSGGKHL